MSTALLEAASNGYAHICALLLNHGANARAGVYMRVGVGVSVGVGVCAYALVCVRVCLSVCTYA